MRLPQVGYRLAGCALALAIVACADGASADPVSIDTLQALWTTPAGKFKSVDLIANPGAILQGQVVDFGGFSKPVVSFELGLSTRSSPGALTITLLLPPGSEAPLSNNPQIVPLAGPTDLYVFGFDFPTFYTPKPMSLEFDSLGVPGGLAGMTKFSFSVVQPVPEPGTVLLLGTGLGSLWLRRRSRHRTAQGPGRGATSTILWTHGGYR